MYGRLVASCVKPGNENHGKLQIWSYEIKGCMAKILNKGRIISRRTGETSRNQTKCQKSEAMVRIRPESRTKRVSSYDSNMIRKPPVTLRCWHCTDQEGTDSYVLFGEYTYVWTRSPQMTLKCWHCADQEGTDSYVLFGEYTYVWKGSPQVTISFGIAPIKRVPTAMIRIRSGSPQVTLIVFI